MGYGAGDRDIRNGCNFSIDRFGKVVATGIKSHDRCRDAGDECMAGYDAILLRKFRPSDYAAQWIFEPLHEGFGFITV
jgi:hypothetical protein